MNEPDPHPNPGRGIYLLPNLFTTAALFSGFYAILSAVDGRFEHAAVAIFAAMILDGLDGRVARMTNTQTDFGAEYDSLSDMVAFGLAPGLVVYLWALQPLGKFGWFAAFVYVAAAALRLARFNTQVSSADKSWFIGLPSPSAAAVTAGWVWMLEFYEVSPADVSIPSAILTIFAGIAMVTRLRYYSFKEINMRGRVPFMALAAIALGIAVVLIQPATVLFLLFLFYTLSGVVTTFARKRRLSKSSAD
jgi:CDP-diacylglycerol--serine O-phosphatidyltransferase